MQLGTFFNQIDSAVKNGEAKSLEKAIESLALAGLSFVDIYASLLRKEYKAKALSAMLKQYGIFAASVFHITEFEYQKNNILSELKEDTKVQLERCAELDCKMYMPVPTVEKTHQSENDRRMCREKIIEHVGDVTDLAKAYGIQVIIENFSDTKTPFATIDDVTYILDQLPEVGYALDTGNFWFGGSDALQAAKLFAPKTIHVHLKDLLPKEDGELQICGKAADSVAIGAGIIPFDEIFSVLTDAGYNKTATIELNTADDLLDKIQMSLRYLHNLDL